MNVLGLLASLSVDVAMVVAAALLCKNFAPAAIGTANRC